MTLAARPVLITDAAPSPAAQHAARRWRYAVLMSGRLALLVLAALTYPVSTWLAVGLLAASIPLPWMAVLIANDAPVRRREDTHRLAAPTAVRAVEARGRVVDG